MKQQSSSANPVWGALDNDTLVQFATFFLSHNVILLSVFVHIVEQREPEIRDKVCAFIINLYYHFCYYIIRIENSNRCISKKARKC